MNSKYKNMKKLFFLLMCVTLLSSCSKYSKLTYDRYRILYRDNNVNRIKCKIDNPLNLRLVVPDTIVSTVNENGTAEFRNISRYIAPIEPSQVKIVDFSDKTFEVEYTKYEIKLNFEKDKNGDFIVSKDKDGRLKGTNFILVDDNLTVIFKNKRKSVDQEISLKK